MVVQSAHLWSSNAPIYELMQSDPRFETIVVVIPSRQPGLENDLGGDDAVAKEMQEIGVHIIRARKSAESEIVDPRKIHPDYVMLQTPYDDQRPPAYGSKYLKSFAKVVYVPYGMLIIGGVDKITHPKEFFDNAWRIFAESADIKKTMMRNTDVLSKKIAVSGYVRHDYYLRERNGASGEDRWCYPRSRERLRVIWNPRWSTHAGDSTFFEYAAPLCDYIAKDGRIDLAFRPHPLMLENARKDRPEEYTRIMALIDKLVVEGRMRIDTKGEYFSLFESSDVFVSDASTLLVDYLPTRKPIVLTTPAEKLNKMGRSLSTGFYRPANFLELTKTLDSLVSGSDPLARARGRSLRRTFPQLGRKTSASEKILKTIDSDHWRTGLGVRA